MPTTTSAATIIRRMVPKPQVISKRNKQKDAVYDRDRDRWLTRQQFNEHWEIVTIRLARKHFQWALPHSILKSGMLVTEAYRSPMASNNLPLSSLIENPMYWQARRCGWDVLRISELVTFMPEIRRAPQHTETWLWWSELPWQRRWEIIQTSRQDRAEKRRVKKSLT